MKRGHTLEDRHLLLVATEPAPEGLEAIFGPIPLAGVPIGGQPLLHWTWARAGEGRNYATTLVVTCESFRHLAHRIPGANVLTVTDGTPLNIALAAALATCKTPVDVTLTSLHHAAPTRKVVPGDSGTTIAVGEPQTVAHDPEALATLVDTVVGAMASAAQQIQGDTGASVPLRAPERLRHGTRITFEDDGETVRKHHPNNAKLLDEVLWYQNLPSDIAGLAPRVVRTGDGWYDTERIPTSTLSDIWVFGALTPALWDEITAQLGNTLDRLHHHDVVGKHDHSDLQHAMYVRKTLDRIKMLRNEIPQLPDSLWSGADVDGTSVPGLDEVVTTLEDAYQRSRLAVPRRHRVIHGDFHLGNLFYRRTDGAVRLIDPRGSFGSQRGIGGDPVYDELKLAHSVIGNYDVVIADAFDLHANERTIDVIHHLPPDGRQGREHVERWLLQRCATEYGLAVEDVNLGVSVLLLSLAALHSDPRQRIAHIARGLQLYGSTR